MLQALYASVDGIQVQQTRMDTIGNDLANVNTTGFKSQDVDFSELISQQLADATAPNSSTGGTNPVEYGLGVRVGATTTDMSQGSLTATNNPSDLAIEGNGYFMTSNGEATSYTRDGSFDLDATGNLVSTDTGQQLLGWTAAADGTVNTTTPLTAASTLSIPIGSLDSAQATTTASLAGNLDSNYTGTTTGSATTTVYDAQGNATDVTVQFGSPKAVTGGKDGAPTGATSSWTWNAYAGDAATGTSLGTSTVYFDASGQPITGSTSGTISVPATGSSSATAVTLNLSGVTQLGSSTALNVASQNGFPSGTLSSYEIGTNGQITGTFTNGLTKTLGQVALASFSNPSGLSNSGSNLFQASANSGNPVVGSPNANGYGSINSGYLEQSNVDLSNSLTNLIVTQRGFEANTKMVSTVDTMLQDLIEMKH
jgi:flagellar hook protein FlgE